MTSIAYVIPTHNRAAELGSTIEALGALPAHDAELIVVDNASASPPRLPARLANGIDVRLILRRFNEGAAARNDGARASDADWIVMLDDDSSPTSIAYLDALNEAPSDVLAISADIHLPLLGKRESGGLPEVFIGCGVALRREAFQAAGGYDPSFHYYAEEYDLAAKLLMMGGRVAFEPRFGVNHFKASAGRDMDTILARLVRNNCWVEQRYAPDADRFDAIVRTRRRYRAIAIKERAERGFREGLSEFRQTIRRQIRTPMSRELYDRFTGPDHARRALQRAHAERRFASAAIVARGKNDWVIERALAELGVPLVRRESADALVVGTMSPGPMLDHIECASDSRLIAGWDTSCSDYRPRLAAA